MIVSDDIMSMGENYTKNLHSKLCYDEEKVIYNIFLAFSYNNHYKTDDD